MNSLRQAIPILFIIGMIGQFAHPLRNATQGVALAQTAPHAPPETQSTSQSTTATPADSQSEMHSLVSGSSLMGATILDRSGQSCGTVDRVTLDSAGQTVHLIVNIGGLLGLGAKEIAIPMSAIRLRADKDTKDSTVWLAVDVSREVLSNAPPLEARESLELTDAGWVEMNARYFGSESNTPLPNSTTTQHGLILTASQMIGHSVVGKGDTATIAKIKDVLFGLGSDPVEYAILGYGGTLGIGERFVAVPFSDLSIRPVGDDDIQIAVPHNSKTLAEQQHVTPTSYPELKLRSVRLRIDR
jgi:sporulation protein YlmC with PRC-barrel domain